MKRQSYSFVGGQVSSLVEALKRWSWRIVPFLLGSGVGLIVYAQYLSKKTYDAHVRLVSPDGYVRAEVQRGHGPLSIRSDELFRNQNTVFWAKFDSQDIAKKLEPGRCYDLTVYGVTSYMTPGPRNILSATRKACPEGYITMEDIRLWFIKDFLLDEDRPGLGDVAVKGKGLEVEVLDTAFKATYQKEIGDWYKGYRVTYRLPQDR